MPTNLPFDLYRGDTYHWQIAVWQDTAKTQPFDLTGVVAKSEIRQAPGGPLLVSLALTIQLPNTILIDLDATDSMKLTANPAVWDLQLTYPSGDVQTILAGAVKVTMDVTGSTPVSAVPHLTQVRR